MEALQPATIVRDLAPAVEKFRAGLPPGYTVAVGGAVEESGKGQRPIARACARPADALSAPILAPAINSSGSGAPLDFRRSRRQSAAAARNPVTAGK